jgi:hypothetical protein
LKIRFDANEKIIGTEEGVLLSKLFYKVLESVISSQYLTSPLFRSYFIQSSRWKPVFLVRSFLYISRDDDLNVYCVSFRSVTKPIYPIRSQSTTIDNMFPRIWLLPRGQTVPQRDIHHAGCHWNVSQSKARIARHAEIEPCRHGTTKIIRCSCTYFQILVRTIAGQFV